MNITHRRLFLFALIGILLTACGGQNSAPNSNNSVDDANQPEQGDSSEFLTMIIGPELVDCVGEGPQQCMRVKFDPDGDWQFFYSHIEGFEFQPGYRYTLLVERLEVKEPPAGGSSLKYVLVEIKEKTEELEMTAGNFAGTNWALTSFGEINHPQGVLEEVKVFLVYDPDEGGISGSAGCNRFFGNAQVDYDQLTFSAGPLGSTRMACSEPIMTQEAAFLDLLGRVTRFSVEDGMLFLFTDNGEVLTFSAEETVD